MNKDYFIELFKYNEWANQRVWDCAKKASQADLQKAQTFSIGSVYQQILHGLELERWWIGFLTTENPQRLSQEEIEQHQDPDKLQQLRDDIAQHSRQYIQSLTDEELARKVRVSWWQETDESLTVAQVLTHIINHSTDHRAQTLAVLHMLGYDGVEQDFDTYLHRPKA